MLKFSYYIVPDSLYNARREFPILHAPARTLVFPLSFTILSSYSHNTIEENKKKEW